MTTFHAGKFVLDISDEMGVTVNDPARREGEAHIFSAEDILDLRKIIRRAVVEIERRKGEGT